MYYIKETEPGLFTVGIGDGLNWEPLADYDELHDAKDEVTRLNGGTVLSDVRQTETILSKREHFAAMALQGILCKDPFGETHACMVQNAAMLADALLSELEETQQQ